MATSSDSPAVTASSLSSNAPTTSDKQAKQPTASEPTAHLANGPSTLESSKPTETVPETSSAAPPSQETSKEADDGIDEVNPHDFRGEVLSNNDIPRVETLRKIENYVVLDRSGKSHTFKSLYSGRNCARRVLIIFVRHFFCGNCQEYLRTLSASITPDALLRLPISTFIAVVGCGDPGLIDMYAQETDCQFPIYADPTRNLYKELGMIRTLALGSKPAYMKKSILSSSIASIFQGLKQIKSGLVMKAGDQRQIGGEFLFEPLTVMTPTDEVDRQLRNTSTNFSTGGESSSTIAVGSDEETSVEGKRVTWCHRMKNTRDHAEVPELREILGLDGDGQPIKDKKRWSKAVGERKGTGGTMARQMSNMTGKSGGT